MTSPLRIGIAGLGTVGGGTLKILSEHSDMLAARTGRSIVISAVSVRDKAKDRGTYARNLRVIDAVAMADDPAIDVVVELIGGADGVAKTLVEKSLQAGKHVVTANKALIAHHGVALAAIAEKAGVVLAFEAAVAGGIPIIKALRDGLAANQLKRVIGILNGTCNYILTSMWESKRSFDEVLQEAQSKGYAEAEPSFDVDGIDTAHKLAILTSLAFGCAPAIDSIHVEGIRRITLRDMGFADELGYAIKLLGITSYTDKGVEQRVHPCMVAKHSPLGTVHGVYNAVVAKGDAVGTVIFEGRGAGSGPTASSVVADIMDIARGTCYKPFTLPVAALSTLPVVGMEYLCGSYYVRLRVVDRSGVLAEITQIFKDQQISMRSFLQHAHSQDETVDLVLTTHDTQESAMMRAIAKIEQCESVMEKPYMIRIENI